MAKGYGFYQNGAAVGDYMFADTNGDGYISEADPYGDRQPRAKGIRWMVKYLVI